MGLLPVSLERAGTPVTPAGRSVSRWIQGVTILAPTSLEPTGDLTPASLTFEDPGALANDARFTDFGPLPRFLDYDSEGFLNLDGWTKLSGATATVSGGEMSVSGASLYQLASQTMAPWVTASATVGARTGKGGPAIVKDSDEFVAAYYDGTNVTIVENGTILTTVAGSFTAPFTFKLMLTGGVCEAYHNGSGRRNLVAIINESVVAVATGVVQYRDPAIWANYRHGFHNVSGTTTLTEYKAGAAGGMGFYNPRLVHYDDGALYTEGHKFFIAADLGNLATFMQSRVVIARIDPDDWSYEIVGIVSYQRQSWTYPGQRIWCGGNDPKLQYIREQGIWLLNWAGNSDDIGPTQERVRGESFVTFAGTPFKEIVFSDPEAIDTVAATDEPPEGVAHRDPVYDIWIRKFGGTWYFAGAESWTDPETVDPENPVGSIAPKPWLASGPNFHTATTRVFRVTDQGVVESGTFSHLSGGSFVHFTGPGIDPSPYRKVFDLGGTEIGTLANPMSSNSLHDAFVRQSGGVTEYWWMCPRDAYYVALGVGFHYSGGPIAFLRADQTSVGYERNIYAPPYVPA